MSTRTLSMDVDPDDERDILAAIAIHQRDNRWEASNEHMLPDGESDTRGATLGEICRDWMEYKERVRKGGGE